MSLPPSFLARPVAHRALHGPGRAENSPEAIRAGAGAGYPLEVDVQLSGDGRAMVFHDYHLGRLTEEAGPLRQRTAEDLGKIPLRGGGGTIPTLAEALALVAGRVPVVVEIKDQDGALGPDVGALEADVARVLSYYDGPVAVMSFNPNSVSAIGALMPGVPRGLVTDPFAAADWPGVPAARRDGLRRMEDLARTGAVFISHNAKDLASAQVAAAKEAGLSVLCWTIRSAAEEAAARVWADNVTFEGYLPPLA